MARGKEEGGRKEPSVKEERSRKAEKKNSSKMAGQMHENEQKEQKWAKVLAIKYAHCMNMPIYNIITHTHKRRSATFF